MKKLIPSLFLSVLCLCTSQTAMAESRFDQMITPVSNPSTFEDPRPQSEVRALFMWHEINDGFFTAGGDTQVYGVQLRLALNERLTFVVNRASLYDYNPELFSQSGSGFGDIELGVKYTFHMNEQAGTAAAWGLGWQMPTGNRDVLQGRGDGFIHPYVSGAVAFNDYNVIGSTGFRVPFSSDDSTFWDANLHVDTPMGDFYPLMELNLIQVIDDGNRIAIDGEGADLFSFGASEARGDTLITSTVGARYRLGQGVDFGIGYQVPLTKGDSSDFMKYRITTDLSFTLPSY